MLKKVPKGNYVLIKGDPGDANASKFLPAGWDKAGLKDKVASGDIKIIGPADGTYTPAWDTTKAQNNMEAIIDKANADNQKIDAVLAENDSTALGVAAALKAKGYATIPISGQDGDTANLQNVAAGHPVRRRLEERQRARQGRRCGCAAALQGHEDGRPGAPGWPRAAPPTLRPRATRSRTSRRPVATPSSRSS